MNINFLDVNPNWVARYHTDRILAKRILETCQVLHAAHAMVDGDVTAKARIGSTFALSRAQMSHPYVKWVMASTENYDWTSKLFSQLCLEFALRSNKMHAYECLVDVLRRRPLLVPVGDLTPFPQSCLPARYRRSDPVEAHRLYYYHEMAPGMDVWSAPARVPRWWHAINAADRATA